MAIGPNARKDDNHVSVLLATDGTTRYEVLCDASGRLVTSGSGSAASSTTATVTQVTDNVASVTLKSANTARKGLAIENTSTGRLYIKLGATAATTSYTVSLSQYGYYEVPFGYTGRVDGIWSAASGGVASITELT